MMQSNVSAGQSIASEGGTSGRCDAFSKRQLTARSLKVASSHRIGWKITGQYVDLTVRHFPNFRRKKMFKIRSPFITRNLAVRWQ